MSNIFLFKVMVMIKLSNSKVEYSIINVNFEITVPISINEVIFVTINKLNLTIKLVISKYQITF